MWSRWSFDLLVCNRCIHAKGIKVCSITRRTIGTASIEHHLRGPKKTMQLCLVAGARRGCISTWMAGCQPFSSMLSVTMMESCSWMVKRQRRSHLMCCHMQARSRRRATTSLQLWQTPSHTISPIFFHSMHIRFESNRGCFCFASWTLSMRSRSWLHWWWSCTSWVGEMWRLHTHALLYWTSFMSPEADVSRTGKVNIVICGWHVESSQRTNMCVANTLGCQMMTYQLSMARSIVKIQIKER